MALTRRASVAGVEIADGHEERSGRGRSGGVVRDDVVARQQPDIAQAAPRVSAQRVSAVDEPAEEQVGAEGRVFAVGSAARPRSAAWPSRRLRRERPAGEPGRPELDTPGQGPRRGPAARCRPGRRPASRPRPRSPRPAPCAERFWVPSSSSRPVRYETPGLCLAETAGVDMQLQGDDTRARPALVDQPQAVVEPESPWAGNRQAGVIPRGISGAAARTAGLAGGGR